MIDISKIDYSRFDRPEILMVTFHPRREASAFPSGGSSRELLIPVEEGVEIDCRFHHGDTSYPNILFFHGNGEIAADYNDIGPMYNQIGANFMAVDYRGYGRSGGNPTLTAMMRDSHLIFRWVREWLEGNDYSGPVVIMGRSLGSASALEISANYADEIEALIIESGFSYILPLLELLGVNAEALGISEEEGPGNLDKISGFTRPTLIIHAEYDHIIPFAEGKALYEACGADSKRLLKIPNADHNSIFFSGMGKYMETIRELLAEIS